MAIMRQPYINRSDIEILIASEVRERIDQNINTACIDRKLNLLIMTEINKYKNTPPRNAVYLAENLDKAINDIVNIVAPQVPAMIDMNEPKLFMRRV